MSYVKKQPIFLTDKRNNLKYLPNPHPQYTDYCKFSQTN